jgi:hypothetical protein
MTTRDILRSDIAELVPASKHEARKLPIRDSMPNNTASLGAAAADAFGIASLPDDPVQIERLINRARS